MALRLASKLDLYPTALPYVKVLSYILQVHFTTLLELLLSAKNEKEYPQMRFILNKHDNNTPL